MSPVLCPACGTEIDAELGPDRIDCICGSRLAIKHGAAGETIVELVAASSGAGRAKRRR
jgi:DNA-directed RNA polymerase subunit RPC12/RpoP